VRTDVPALDGGPDGSFKLDRRPHLVVHAAVELPPGVRAGGPAGSAHGKPDGAERCFRIGAVRGDVGNADRDADLDPQVRVCRERDRECLGEALRAVGRRVCAATPALPLNGDGIFVRPDTHRAVIGANDAPGTRRNLAQHRIANMLTMNVVHCGKAVEVEGQNRAGLIVRLGPRRGLYERHEGPAVRQAGQTVLKRERGRGALCLFGSQTYMFEPREIEPVGFGSLRSLPRLRPFHIGDTGVGARNAHRSAIFVS